MNTPWSCYLDATVKCTGVHEGQLLSLIGHDGSEIIAPHLPEPFCRRGFHPYSVAIAMLNLGWVMSTIHPIIEEYRDGSAEPISVTKVTNLRATLIALGQPIIWGSQTHATGYLPEELGQLPVQEPYMVTILTKVRD